MKNKGLLLGLYILGAMLIAGCGNQSQKTEEKQDSQAGEETPGETEEPQESADEPQTVSGTVRSFTGGYLSIRDEKGDVQSFDLGDAELACENGILAGAEVTLDYVSEMDELTNEETARLLRVSDREGAKPLGEQMMEGTVLDASANTLTVQGIGDNGRDIITFFTVGTEFQCENGIGPDDEITLTYRGDLQGNNARNVKALSVKGGSPEETAAPEETQTAAESGEETPAGGEEAKDAEKTMEETGDTAEASPVPGEPAEDSPAPEKDDAAAEDAGAPKEAEGSIVRVDGTLLVAELKDEPGEEYEFDLSDTKIDLKYGLLEGSEVLLTYRENSGEETAEAAPLLSLADVDPEVVNESTGGFSITGTVMATGANTMTVTSDDGAQITCTTEDAEIGGDAKNFPREGAYVVVVIEPDSNSNVYRALSIDPAY